MLSVRRFFQMFALSWLFAGIASFSLYKKAPVLDADVWWHLKAGDWIVEHHAFPHTGIFSRTAATRPWTAYSWGYEVLLSRAYAWFGLMGLALFGILLTVAVAAAFFWMLNRLSGRFWLSWILCAVVSFSFVFNVLPRPVFFSMIFYAVALVLVLEAEREGSVRPLYWLPVVFALWANFHIQFIYGLLMVGLCLATNLLKSITSKEPALPPKPLAGIFAACILACCVGPYTYGLFRVILEYSRAQFPYMVLEELQPLDFRHLSDYILAATTIGAFAHLIRQSKLDLFRLTLLIVASVFAFRALRDAWFLAICAGAILSCPPSRENEWPSRFKLREWAAVGGLLTLWVLLVARVVGFDTRGLDRAISSRYPVDAVNFLRRNPAPGPLYNDFGWGGFLIWYMPNYPVAIDGRTDLYGDETDLMTFKSVSGDYGSDPYLKEARLVLLPKDTPLARLLLVDAQFRVVYGDQLAIVFVRNQ